VEKLQGRVEAHRARTFGDNAPSPMLPPRMRSLTTTGQREAHTYNLFAEGVFVQVLTAQKR